MAMLSCSQTGKAPGGNLLLIPQNNSGWPDMRAMAATRVPHFTHLARCAVLLLICGSLWGAIPMLSKVAAESGAHPIGLSLVVNCLGVIACTFLCLQQKKLRVPTPREMGFFFNWAILYAVFNQVLVYWLSTKIDAAVVSAFTVLEGLMIFAAASCIGLEKPSLLRCAGLLTGLAGSLLLVVSPNLFHASGQPSMSPLLMLAGLLVPLSYAAESIYMAAKRPPDVDPLYAVLGVMLFSVPMLFVLALATDDFVILQFPLGKTEYAAIGIMVATVIANILYFRLIAIAGSVFSGQISYFNALFGIGWAVVVLGESWPLSMMVAFSFMLAGLLLVKPQAVPMPRYSLRRRQPWPAE
jgi:drug/metabolite transporter (DMT)-like permease